MKISVIMWVNGENLEERLGTISERKDKGKRSFRNKIKAKSEKRPYGQEEC